MASSLAETDHRTRTAWTGCRSALRISTSAGVPELWGMPAQWATWSENDTGWRVTDDTKAKAGSSYPNDAQPLVASGYAEGDAGHGPQLPHLAARRVDGDRQRDLPGSLDRGCEGERLAPLARRPLRAPRRYGRRVIELERGDITTAHADAIVCGAGGALEAAIRRAGGPRLVEAMALIKRPGVTHAGDLHARFVIHTVVPADEERLPATYRAVLAQAAALGCERVALPALGAAFHPYRVAKVAFDAAVESPIPDIRFWLHDDETFHQFDQARLFRTPPLRAARRGDWRTEPDPPLRPLAFEKTLDANAAATLALGTVPEEMEDKWFVFQEGDRLHLHRSWTGILVFRVAVTAGRLHSVEFNETQFKGTDEEAAQSLGHLVDRLADRA
jgi:O-acetyl-ADP-ribose deacetylase (regulator of RNase III)